MATPRDRDRELSLPDGQRGKVRMGCQCEKAVPTMYSFKLINNMIPQGVVNVESLTETHFRYFVKGR